MIKRKLWEDIGRFDEDVSFWCSDDVVIEQVKDKGVLPMIVLDAIVEHKPSSTVSAMPARDQLDMKWGNIYIFNKKYGKEKFADHPDYQRWLRRNVR
jgi:GT2 family glycosyltransferase